jgi:plasmid stabilization system protein ParE
VSLRVEQSPKFRRDVIAVYERYTERENESLADRFQNAVTSTLNKLSVNPEMGPICRISSQRIANVRYFRVEAPFDRHLIFYRIDPGFVRAVRLVHGMRDLPQRLRD